MYSLEEISQYRATDGVYVNKLVLDTNLLLLLCIGSFKIESLSKLKCTARYSSEDYILLLKILDFFQKQIIITPHILAEFSNISKNDIKDSEIAQYLVHVVEKLKGFQEQHIPLVGLLILNVGLLARFGFPDIGIIEAAKILNAFILTDDGALSRHANDCQIPNCYFQNIRTSTL